MKGKRPKGVPTIADIRKNPAAELSKEGVRLIPLPLIRPSEATTYRP